MLDFLRSVHPAKGCSSKRRGRPIGQDRKLKQSVLTGVESLEARALLAITDGYYTLMAPNGKFVVAHQDGTVTATASAPSREATFRLMPRGQESTLVQTPYFPARTSSVGGFPVRRLLDTTSGSVRWFEFRGGVPRPGIWFKLSELGNDRIALMNYRGYLSVPGPGGTLSPIALSIGASETFVLQRSAYAPVDNTINIKANNTQPILVRPGPNAVAGSPMAINIPMAAVNAGAINGPGTSVVLSGGGTLRQSGAVNALALVIPVQTLNTGLGLTGLEDKPTTLQLVGNAVVDCPSGVFVDGQLGMSPGAFASARTTVYVNANGLLSGSGKIAGRLLVTAAGEVSPASDALGTSPHGRLEVGQLTLAEESIVRLQVAGPTAGTTHDQFVVKQGLSIAGSRLHLTATYAPAVGSQVVLIDNQSAGKITGTFRDAFGNPLPEGAVVARDLAGSGSTVVISYKGGDGNDVTLRLATSPNAPVAVTGSTDAGPGAVRLAWTAPVSDGGSAISDYEIQYSSDNGGKWTTFIDGSSSQTTAVVTGLTVGAGYVFRVRASNGVGQGSFSPSSPIITPTGVTGVPNSPRDLTATSGRRQIFLRWAAPAIDGGSPITDYVVEVSSDGGTTWLLVNDGVSTNTTATVSSLPFALRTFRISAKNAIGTGTGAVVAGRARW